MTPIDCWTLHHFLGGLALGLFAWNAFPRSRRLDFVALLPIAWEVFECNVLASWLRLFPVESMLNSVVDIAVSVAGALLGLMLGRRL